jgi:hypothetical protein
MASTFRSVLSAEISVPDEGFTLDDLKAHMRAQKIPTDARLKPAVVGNAMDPGADDEVRFRAEWQATS